MLKLIGFLKQRFSEPSSHNGLAVVLAVASMLFPQYANELQAVALFFGAIGIALPDVGTMPRQALAAWIPPVHIATNPALAESINIGVQAAITHLLTQPVKK